MICIGDAAIGEINSTESNGHDADRLAEVDGSVAVTVTNGGRRLAPYMTQEDRQ